MKTLLIQILLSLSIFPAFAANYQGPVAVNPAGETRKAAQVYLPTNYNGTAELPLLILLHGFGATSEIQDSYLKFRDLVSARGFILATPQGLLTPAGTKIPGGSDVSGYPFWNATDFCCDFAKTGVDDVSYLNRLIDTISAQYKVDAKRIYLFGHSNGGFMSNRLACEIGDRLAGIVALAGGAFLNETACAKPVPVAYLQVHAVNDGTIAYGPSKTYAGGVQTVQQWVKKNGCNPTVITDLPKKDFLLLKAGAETNVQEWQACASQKPVAFWTIEAFTADHHNPHIPFFTPDFGNAVMDFLLKQSR